MFWSTRSPILGSYDDHIRLLFSSRDPQKIYHFLRRPFDWSEIDDHHPILVVLYEICQRCYHLHPTLGGEVTSEYGLVNGISKRPSQIPEIYKGPLTR